MNTARKILSAAAVALLAATGAAHADSYNPYGDDAGAGVTSVNSLRSRAEVQAEAVATARVGNPYSDSAYAGVTQVNGSSTVDRNATRAQAVAAAHDPLQNLDRKSYVNSTIPSQYTNGSLAVRRQQQSQQAAL